MRRLVLYGRPDCHLCDEAREILIRLVGEARDVELVERNIEDENDLLREYLERIPVIELEGQVISELIPEPRALRSSLLNTSAR
ncbi:MAG: glutaredoxin family protein [Actinomycetota bacterium]|nr:glutaredoxin family protein [Actinomycetota bacterium]